MSQADVADVPAAEERDSGGLGGLISGVVNDIRTLIADVLALGQAEVKPMGKHLGIGVGLIAVALVFVVNAVSLLLVAGSLAIARLFGARLLTVALGFAIMAVVLLIIAVILGLIGYFQTKKVGAPKKTIAAAKEAGESIQYAISRGVANAKTHELAAKNFDEDPETYGYR